MAADSYFEPIAPGRYQPTEHVGGAWAEDEQHVAPALGLLCHAIEQHRDRRGSDMLVSRLSYDILGPMPLEPCDVEVEVARAGRTVELVEASLTCAGRVGVRVRAWLLQPAETSDLAGGEPPHIASWQQTPSWQPAELWPGGFIRSVEVRRSASAAPGRGQVWVRTDVPLVGGEEVTPLAAAVGLLDIANGMNVRADPGQVLFPNVDLTAHFFRPPRAGWLGLDTTVSFGPAGQGLTNSVIHDEDGAVGSVLQCLTVRPRTGAR